MAEAVLKGIYTVQSKLDELPQKNGQLIFVGDVNKICMDFNDKRIIYEQIVTLKTESERTSLLAPSDLFYFVIETCVLWRYTKGQWNQLTTNPAMLIQYAESSFEFPDSGDEKVLYVAENHIYRWDGTTSTYKKMTVDENDLLLAITSVKEYVDEQLDKKITRVESFSNLPAVGDKKVQYVVRDENATYRWDEDELKYYCIGRDYNNIEIIDTSVSLN